MGNLLEIKTNADEVADFVGRFSRDQVPFAMSKAINQTAFDFREEERRGLRERFTVRRPFVAQGIRIAKRSTKRDLESVVEVEGRRDFLFKQEEGGRIRPRGRSRVIPLKDAKRGKTGVVSNRNRPRAFDLKEHGRGSKAEVFRGNRRTFLIRRADGSGKLLQRRGRGNNDGIRELFRFSSSVDLPPRLKFEETAERVFADRFETNFSKAFDDAVRTAR